MTNSVRRAFPATVAALIGAGLLAGCGGNDTEATDDTTGAAATTSTSATSASTGSATASSSSSAAPAGQSGLVYYVTETSMGDRLVAESTALTGSSPLDAALAAVQTGKPDDPDYRTMVPPKSLASPVVDGGEIHVDVTGASWTKALVGTAPADAKLAIQQVVYSLNAANGSADKPLPVHFTVNGKPSTYLGQPALEKPAPQPRTLSLMNVYSPVDGTQLDRGTTTFDGVANSNEANVLWEVRDSSDKVVLKGHTMADGWMDKDYPWKAEVDLSKLSPGHYTFVASTDDPSDGEGSGPVTDSKAFTLQ